MQWIHTIFLHPAVTNMTYTAIMYSSLLFPTVLHHKGTSKNGMTCNGKGLYITYNSHGDIIAVKGITL